MPARAVLAAAAWACILAPIPGECAPLDLAAEWARGSPTRADPGWLPAAVLVDFDPAGLVRTGLDASDDLAFLALVGAPDRALVLGATVTYGNALLTHTTGDAFQLLKIAGVEDTVPRVPGSADWTGRRPLSSRSAAAEFLAREIFRRPPRTVTVVCLGPLTNLAAALTQYPDLAGMIRAVVMSEGVHGAAGPGLDVNLAGADPEATRVVLAAAVPRVLVPWSTCERAPMTPALFEAARAMCPGAAACEYRSQLRRAADRAAGRRGWLRVAWDTVFGDAEAEERAAAGDSGALGDADLPSDADAAPATGADDGDGDDDDDGTPGREGATRGRLRRASAPTGGVLCDLVAMSAVLAPFGFREWDAMAVDVSAWRGREEAVIRAGFSAAEAQALLADADGRGRVVPPAFLRPPMWEPGPGEPPAPPQDALMGLNITDPGVVLVPRKPQVVPVDPDDPTGPTLPAPLVHALAMAFSVPHGEPHREMRGSYNDDGLLNPFIMWPLVAAASIVAVGCTGCLAAAVFTWRKFCRPRKPRTIKTE